MDEWFIMGMVYCTFSYPVQGIFTLNLEFVILNSYWWPAFLLRK